MHVEKSLSLKKTFLVNSRLDIWRKVKCYEPNTILPHAEKIKLKTVKGVKTEQFILALSPFKFPINM